MTATTSIPTSATLSFLRRSRQPHSSAVATRARCPSNQRAYMPEISELEAQTYCENRMGEQDASGRDLRLIWEEHLDEAARRRIRRAIWRGHALADPDEAAVAVARARGMRRAVKWTALLNVVIGGSSWHGCCPSSSSRPPPASGGWSS